MADFLGSIAPTIPLPDRISIVLSVATERPRPLSPDRIENTEATASFRDIFTTSSGGGGGVIIPTSGQIFPHPSFGGGGY